MEKCGSRDERPTLAALAAAGLVLLAPACTRFDPWRGLAPPPLVGRRHDR